MREQDEVEGHAVRALYLAAGVTDIYMETGEAALLDAMHAQWRDMAGRKAYVTGGVGAHHMDEAFGDAYELPPDRCYGETCAAIASVLWNWRMLLVTGEARFADLLERTLYNGVLAGLALDGGGYSYVNPLHVREGHRDPVERGARRQPWYACACCPPNVMRLLASLQRYVATRDDDGVQIHQYATGTFGPVRVRTDYPWDGRVDGRGARARAAASACACPHWGSARLDGRPVEPGYVSAGARHGHARARHDAAARAAASAHRRRARLRWRSSAGRSSTASRPSDAPAGTIVDDLRLTGGLEAVARPDLLGGIVAVEADGAHAPADGLDMAVHAGRSAQRRAARPALGGSVRAVGQPRRRRDARLGPAGIAGRSRAARPCAAMRRAGWFRRRARPACGPSRRRPSRPGSASGRTATSAGGRRGSP